MAIVKSGRRHALTILQEHLAWVRLWGRVGMVSAQTPIDEFERRLVLRDAS
jgi:hypothetical protein